MFHLAGQFCDFLAGSVPHHQFFVIIPAVCEFFAKRFLLFVSGHIQGDSAAVASFLAAEINEPASDQHGGVFQKSAPGAGIPMNGLVKGHHGDAQFIVLAFDGRAF